MSALLTCGSLRSTLAVTRSLGKRGVSVTVGDTVLPSLASQSQFCKRGIIYPCPREDNRSFVEEIVKEAIRGKYDVILPMDDITLCTVAEARAKFEDLAVLPFPELDAIKLAHDKAALMSLAEEKGISVPRTVIVGNSAHLDTAIEHIGLPAVVKARFSSFRTGNGWSSGGRTHYVDTEKDLKARCEAIQESVPFPLVQEYIPGEGRGIFLLMNHGQVRAAFAHRRIREKPPSGGVSVLSESVGLDPDLLAYSERLLEGLKWHGVAMVEFKHDARDGTPKLLEINGRFWGSLQLAVDAGVDFPYLLYRLAVDGEVEPVLSYREGVRLRWWLGDLDWLFLRLRDGGDFQARGRAVREFLGPTGNTTKGEVFRWDDPRPAFEELSQYARHSLGAVTARLRSGFHHG